MTAPSCWSGNCGQTGFCLSSPETQICPDLKSWTQGEKLELIYKTDLKFIIELCFRLFYKGVFMIIKDSTGSNKCNNLSLHTRDQLNWMHLLATSTDSVQSGTTEDQTEDRRVFKPWKNQDCRESHVTSLLIKNQSRCMKEYCSGVYWNAEYTQRNSSDLWQVKHSLLSLNMITSVWIRRIRCSRFKLKFSSAAVETSKHKTNRIKVYTSLSICTKLNWQTDSEQTIRAALFIIRAVHSLTQTDWRGGGAAGGFRPPNLL